VLAVESSSRSAPEGVLCSRAAVCSDATPMRRGSIWIPVAGTVCALALAGMECVTLDQQDVRERLARFVEEHDANQVPPRFEAIYGETIDGNAIDDYVAASQLLAPLRLGWCHTFRESWRKKLTQRGQPLGEGARREIAPTLANALLSIRRGVRCATVLPKGRSFDSFGLEAVVDDALDQAFAAHDTRTLVELFVDRWVFIGHVWSPGHPRPEFQDDWLHALDADSARWFGAVLGRLDVRHCCFMSPAGWIAWYVGEIADRTPLQQSFESGLSAWRWGFDSHWRGLVACDRLVAGLPELAPPASDWTRRQGQIATFGSALGDIEEGWATRVPDWVKVHESQLRAVLTHLRLLRLAVAFVHGLELEHLADPLGSGPIEVEIRGDEATFRSEGMCGKERLARTVRRR